MLFVIRNQLGLLLYSLFHTAAVAEVAMDTDDHIQSMINWLQSMNDGFFSPKIKIRRMDPNDPSSYYGLFATQDLREDELLLRIPPGDEIRIQIDDPTYYADDLCDLMLVRRGIFHRISFFFFIII